MAFPLKGANVAGVAVGSAISGMGYCIAFSGLEVSPHAGVIVEWRCSWARALHHLAEVVHACVVWLVAGMLLSCSL